MEFILGLTLFIRCPCRHSDSNRDALALLFLLIPDALKPSQTLTGTLSMLPVLQKDIAAKATGLLALACKSGLVYLLF